MLRPHRFALGGALGFLSSKGITTHAKPSLPSVVLYQYEPCPYCNKVKAVLDFYKVPYTAIEVNPWTKKETKFSGYNKVPLALIDGQLVTDSADIVNTIQNMFDDKPRSAHDEKWLTWVDEKFIRMLPPNIYRTLPESLQSFDYVLTEGKFTTMEKNLAKYGGALAMYFIAKRLKKRHGLNDDVRSSLYEAIDSWLQAIGDQPYFGGSTPSVVDVTMFGVLRSIVGLDTFHDTLHFTNIEPWFNRMVRQVGESHRIAHR